MQDWFPLAKLLMVYALNLAGRWFGVFFEGWGRMEATGTENGGKDISLKWATVMKDYAY